MIEQIISDFADRHLCSSFTCTMGIRIFKVESVFCGHASTSSPSRLNEGDFEISISERSIEIFLKRFGIVVDQDNKEKVFCFYSNRMIDLEKIYNSLRKNRETSKEKQLELVKSKDIRSLCENICNTEP